MLAPESMVDKVRRQTIQVLKGSNNKRMLIEANPEVIAAMEQAEKKHGSIFPPEMGGTYFARPNPALHMEKFTVRPLAEKKAGEAKKDCRILH